MRVLKDKTQSFLAGVCGLQGKLFFSAAALLFFDLERPDVLLPEKDLWRVVKARVPKPVPFDVAKPKPQAEVLVHGNCHPRQGAQLDAARVRLQLGDVDKTLFVFGPRHWERTTSGWTIRHDAVPEAPLPVTWRYAFGGPGFPDNPEGLGHTPLKDERGGVFHPLPRIEDPGNLIGAPTDAPRPVGFAPVEQTRPVRLARAGTYDDAWYREHWPYLPQDFDLRFFNTAPEDQQLHERYWRGDEILRIEGMHPRRAVLSSRLPGLKVRCFATLLDDPGADRKDLSKARFQELHTNLDTVWLFPEDMRGALCFRGQCEIRDDEYRDVLNVLLVTEALDDEEAGKRPLDYYRELRDTWVERMLKLDRTQMREGRQAVADTMEHLKNLPAELQERLDMALGSTPSLPHTPEELIIAGHGRLDAAASMLGRMEALAIDLRRKHGHLVRIDTDHFTTARQHIENQRKNLDEAGQKLAETMREVDKRTKEASAKALERKASLKAKGIDVPFDPETLLLPPLEKRWPKSALRQLTVWRGHLLNNEPLMKRLKAWGITGRTIDNACLGYNPAPLALERKPWGLEPPEGGATWFTVPSGLVMPQFDAADPVALRIRLIEPVESDVSPDHFYPPLGGGDYSVPGSRPLEKASLMLGVGARQERIEGRPVICAGDPLEVLFLSQSAGDWCTVLLCALPDDPLDQRAQAALQAAPAVLVAVSGLKPASAELQWKAWRTARPDAIRLDFPWRGVFEAVRLGRDVRGTVRRALPPTVAEHLPRDEAPLKPGDVAPGMALPKVDVKAVCQQAATRVREQAEAVIGPLRAEAMAQKEQAVARVTEKLRALGLDPERYLRQPPQGDMLDFGAMKQEIVAGMAKARATLKGRDHLTPEREAALADVEKKSLAMLDHAAAKVTPDGAIRPPVWVEELRAKHGLDPESGQGPTRERVAAMLEAGVRDFRGMLLSGLDLSGLDFSGADLRGALCMETNFAGSRFTKASLAKAVCRRADFTGAVLRQCDLERCMLQQANLVRADLNGARCVKTLFATADCSDADLSGADLTRSVFLGVILTNAGLRNVTARRTMFKDALLGGVDFAKSDLQQCLFLSCDLGGLDFSGLLLHRATFLGCKGENVLFQGAKMENARFLKGCALPGARFTGAVLRNASAVDCSFTGAQFIQARMDKTLLQDCDLGGCSLCHTRARQARFMRCNLERADMRGLDLLQGSLRKSRLVKADLTRSNLFGVDFFKAVLGGTILDHADTKRSLLERREDLLPKA